MVNRNILSLMVTASIFAATSACALESGPWQKEFQLSSCALSTTGRNTFFVLEPGFRIVLEDDDTKVQITVLDETRKVDGVLTRVVEEKEWKDGELYEVAMNYFAICGKTKDVFYFGEEVDFYENGKVVKHDGAWLAGKDGAKAGMIMSGSPMRGMKYYQEIAPGIAMDRAEIIKLDEVCETPAGTFKNCLRIKEGTALNPFEVEYKFYAPNIGLIGDADLKVKKYGFLEKM